MIDTHSHIYLSDFDKDREEIMQRAVAAGVKSILMPAIDIGSLKQMDQLTHDSITFYKMAGIHPCDVKEVAENFEELLLELCEKEEVIGVGETGLDYYWSTDFVNDQKISLKIHCCIAKQTGKPIVLHNRESTDELLDLIETEQDGRLKGIWHCFNGTVEEGKRAIDMGLHLGIGGVVTFKNGGVDKTVAQLPLDKMVLETDAPYLAPSPMRGKRNEPSFIKYIAEKLADIFKMEVNELVNKTSLTASKLFSLDGIK